MRSGRILNLNRRPALVRFVLALVVLIAAIALWSSAPRDEPGPDSDIRAIEAAYGVRVHHVYDPSEFFPPRWLRPPISAGGKQLPAHEVVRMLPIIESFLSVYPKRVVTENLDAIYLLAELTAYGKSYGATNSRSGLYIKNRGIHNGYTRAFLFSRMHSEFSSILMRNHPFPEGEWRAINPSDFRYAGKGRYVLGRPELYGQSPDLLTAGFIVAYAQSSLENDFNMIADWLFTRPDELKKLAREHPRIAAKRDLAIRFYESIDERFGSD